MGSGTRTNHNFLWQPGPFSWRPLAFVGALFVSSCAALLPGATTLDERIFHFPRHDLALREPVTVRWNQYLVPYITANNNHDLAYTMGLVQGHLRASQVQVLKRIAYARLSELGGPFSQEVDHFLALVNFPQAADAIYASLPPATKQWIDAFADGFNHVMLYGQRPKDFGLLNLEPEPITNRDIIAMGRVIGADINWGRYISLLRERKANPKDWEQRFVQALRFGYGFEAEELPLAQVSRSGSNSMALAPERSASGGALLLSDPHLGFILPNAWLLIGVKSPDIHAVGGMAPGLPFIAFGRNPTLAWGGTNMRSASSDLYRVQEHDITQTRTHRLRNRFYWDDTLTLRATAVGPVLSDHPWFPSLDNEHIALRWKGHQVSDEISAFLRLNRARSVFDVASAMQDFAVSGQHIIAADSEGNIGHIPAVHLPERRYRVPPDLILDSSTDGWNGYDDSTTLDTQINPPRGFVMSANDQPAFMSQKLGYFFNVPDRTARMNELLRQARSVDFTQAVDLQTDTQSPASRALAQELVALMSTQQLSSANRSFIDQLHGWDGDYNANASQPVVFETLLYHLAYTLYSDKLDDNDELPNPYASFAWLVTRLPQDLRQRMPELGQGVTVNQVIDRARADADNFATWGDMHYLQAGPVYANIPVLGRLFPAYRFGVGGSRQTLMKTNHGLVNESHKANFGSQSRHISDMSDPDANYFVLLGGQDGWLGSDNYADQIPLWRQRRYIQLPLTDAKVAELFVHSMQLQPLETP